MRKTRAILLAGLVCCMLVATGCTGPGVTAPATPPAVTTATPVTAVPAADITSAVTSASAPIPASWSGIWNTSYSSREYGEVIEVLTLVQNGSSVTGTYHQGNGTLSATEQDGRLTGTWHDFDTNGTYSGLLAFERSEDERSFTGKWVSTGEGTGALKNTTQFWNGARI